MATYKEIVEMLQYYTQMRKKNLKKLIVIHERNGNKEDATFAKGQLDEIETISHDINFMLGKEEE